MKTIVKRLSLDLGDKKVELTVDQAKDLSGTLDALFDRLTGCMWRFQPAMWCSETAGATYSVETSTLSLKVA